jgi:lauroyl/myristoyl acyltransferase
MTEAKPHAGEQSTGRGWLARLGVSRRDLGLVGSLLSLATAAWCVPESHWDRLCRGLVWMQPWRHRRERLARFGFAAAVAGRRPGLTADACARAHLANVYCERLQLLASHRPGRRPPRPRLDGRAHLEVAIGEGKGVILWVGPFLFSDLLTKVALHDAGFAVSHLSRFSHGFSGSRAGERLLNPIRTSVERRYLAERLVMGREGSVAALRELSRRLRANRVVSISAIGMAHQLYQIPFLNGSVQMARGAPSLAIQTGAPLLPVFTGRDPGGNWVMVIEPPLVRSNAWDRDEAVKRLLLQYAALLEYYVTCWPDQFCPGQLDFQTS